jgi:hypothetical protein
MILTFATWRVYGPCIAADIVAAGVALAAETAVQRVETTLAGTAHATIGTMTRLTLPGLHPEPAELAGWPPLGQVMLCQRTRAGGYKWLPLFRVPHGGIPAAIAIQAERT